jgi:putative hemolysin
VTAGALQVLAVELALIGLMAVFSAAESALRAVRRPETLEKYAGSRTERRFGPLRDRASRYIAAVAIADFFTTFALAAIAAAYVAPRFSEILQLVGFNVVVSGLSAVLVTVIAVSILAIVFGLLLPRAIAARHPTKVLYVLTWPIHVVALLFAPIVGALVGLTRVFAKPFGASPEADVLVTQEELKALVETGEEQGVLEKEERKMIYSIFELGDTEVREVMVPRPDVVGLDVSVPVREALDTVVRSSHSRIPVFKSSLDDIVGILYAKDLFRLVARGRFDQPLKEILRPVFFVPETKKVDDLLREMREQKVHLAIVVDEYGGTAGLVTIEDLIEQIVGEIRDEFEVEEERVVLVSENEAVMDARVPFGDVNDSYELGVEPTDDYGTLGGFISHELGRVPRAGDSVRRGNVVLTVESVQGSRASKVRVKREVPLAAGESR